MILDPADIQRFRELVRQMSKLGLDGAIAKRLFKNAMTEAPQTPPANVEENILAVLLSAPEWQQAEMVLDWIQAAQQAIAEALAKPKTTNKADRPEEK